MSMLYIGMILITVVGLPCIILWRTFFLDWAFAYVLLSLKEGEVVYIKQDIVHPTFNERVHERNQDSTRELTEVLASNGYFKNRDEKIDWVTCNVLLKFKTKILEKIFRRHQYYLIEAHNTNKDTNYQSHGIGGIKVSRYLLFTDYERKIQDENIAKQNAWKSDRGENFRTFGV